MQDTQDEVMAILRGLMDTLRPVVQEVAKVWGVEYEDGVQEGGDVPGFYISLPSEDGIRRSLQIAIVSLKTIRVSGFALREKKGTEGIPTYELWREILPDISSKACLQEIEEAIRLAFQMTMLWPKERGCRRT